MMWMLRATSLEARVPLSRVWKRLFGMKVLSVVGRNSCRSMLAAAERRVRSGVERRRAIFSWLEREMGMLRAERAIG